MAIDMILLVDFVVFQCGFLAVVAFLAFLAFATFAALVTFVLSAS
jgi:hypothetical protein